MRILYTIFIMYPLIVPFALVACVISVIGTIGILVDMDKTMVDFYGLETGKLIQMNVDPSEGIEDEESMRKPDNFWKAKELIGAL